MKGADNERQRMLGARGILFYSVKTGSEATPGRRTADMHVRNGVFRLQPVFIVTLPHLSRANTVRVVVSMM